MNFNQTLVTLKNDGKMKLFGGEFMINEKSNSEIAISALTEASHNHFEGEYALYRMAAYVPVEKGASPAGLQRQLNKLKKELLKLRVKADRIMLFDDMLEISFFPNGYQMVMTRGQYAGLQLEFAEFLDDSGIDGIKIQGGCYNDDPDYSVTAASNHQINFFPEFNSLCFGARSDDPIEVVNACFDKEYSEVA